MLKQVQHDKNEPYIAIGIPENRDVILKGMFWGFLRFLSSIDQRVILLGNDDDMMIPGKTSYIDNMRNRIVKRAMEEGCTHLMFVDSDTIPPPGALEMLLGADKDIVAGVYRFRVPPYRVLAFWHVAGHYVPMDELPKNELLKVDGMGMGCTLIRMEVFKKLKKPWFKAGYTGIKSPYLKNIPLPQPAAEGLSSGKGDKKQRYVGEDIWFCEKAARAGYDIYLDTRIQCDHITQMMIPGSLETPELPWVKEIDKNKIPLVFNCKRESP